MTWESMSDIILGERSKYLGGGGGEGWEKDGETAHCCNMYSSNNIHVQFHCNSSKYLAKIIQFPLLPQLKINLWCRV